jgi:hypothetical protein
VPTFAFPDLISDLVGEKLAEEHVRTVLSRLPSLATVPTQFQLLVPVLGWPPRYRLYIQEIAGRTDFQSVQEAKRTDCKSVLHTIRPELQTALEENPYYRHAVAIGQLAPVEVALLDGQHEPAWMIYERRCLERGQKCGAIKPVVLDRWTGWPERFAPIVLDTASADTPQHILPNRESIP